MKRILFVVAILGYSMGVWAATDSFTFVSTLSAPVASFREVETKQGVNIPAGSQFNAGSGASSTGTIQLQGTKPMIMNKLTMQNNTAISGNAKWLVDELIINTNGSVEISSLIANTVTVTPPDSGEAVLTVNNNLLVTNKLIMKDGKATSSLLVQNGSSKFHFINNGPETGGSTTISSNIFVFVPQ